MSANPTERMKAKLQQRLGPIVKKAQQHLRPGETFDAETGEFKPPANLNLRWCEPVTHKDGTGHQVTECGLYEVRKTMTKDQPITYWAWLGARKLLGYKATPDEGRELCEARHRREATCQ